MEGPEISSQVVGWASFLVTALGLGGLITQANAINDKLDPFHESRTVEYLGIWFQRQDPFPWWTITKPPPHGPLISASMAGGFCAMPNIYITRIPLLSPGKAGWSMIMSMFNPEPPSRGTTVATTIETGITNDEEKAIPQPGSMSHVHADSYAASSRTDAWAHLKRQRLSRHKSSACAVISRTTLITMLVATNGRAVFHYTDASGLRSGYASYCGQWYITWPIGEEALVKFAPHDSIGASEVLPRSFAQRIERCGEIVCGVVSSKASGLNVAFCGRKSPGIYCLRHLEKGFQGAHGSRHLYNMLGGKAFQVDFMAARKLLSDDEVPDGTLVLALPSTEAKAVVQMAVPLGEQELIRHALDCLPWTALSWSIHRGMRDVLTAFGKPVMDKFRGELAAILRRAVTDHAEKLDARGWDPEFVRSSMAHMASSAVLAGEGNSGDAVRVVSDIVVVLVGEEWDAARFDCVNFWRKDPGERTLDHEGIVALTKMFVLEWSIEFDYQMYHNLPMSLYFG
ncbi:uncharacterized protein B0I36DRAFT_325592 [Microdochium trichocladiopsis]|uniref:Uncharacterized protein n=1 Tax=Microdochium trichocladiopsis TaxID=1682393 RepID=A0A9P9BPQ6_9PEZI|nr:uncharacterized protein B0I36DRAFT_325592 [Microdochium trichocladiopsis]KAH7029350.1 hypothetical protein B0I36DRAFT_325592 [Microdochium trichocladiopsis]